MLVTKKIMEFLLSDEVGTMVLEDPTIEGSKKQTPKTVFLAKMKTPHQDKEGSFIALLYSEYGDRISDANFKSSRIFYINPKKEIFVEYDFDLEIEEDLKIRSKPDVFKDIHENLKKVWSEHLLSLPDLSEEDVFSDKEKKEMRDNQLKNILSRIIFENTFSEKEISESLCNEMIQDMLSGEEINLFLKGKTEKEDLYAFFQEKAKTKNFKTRVKNNEFFFLLYRYLIQKMEKGESIFFVKDPAKVKEKVLQLKEIEKNCPKTVSLGILDENKELIFVKAEGREVIRTLLHFYSGKNYSLFPGYIAKPDRDKMEKRYGKREYEKLLSAPYIKSIVFRNKTIFEMDASIINFFEMKVQ